MNADMPNDRKHRVLRQWFALQPEEKQDAILEPHYLAAPPEEQGRAKERVFGGREDYA